MSFKHAFIFLVIVIVSNSSLLAQDSTRVTVRALANDAKFIGTSMGGAMITITNSATGDTLARGLTKGGTGNTNQLVKQPRRRHEKLSTLNAAKFTTTIALNAPTKVTISATAPWNNKASRATVSQQHWLIPGQNISGDGIILTVPGFAISLIEPGAGQTINAHQAITVTARIEMMCGCPTEPGGLWNSNDYTIKAKLMQNNQPIESHELSYAGSTSLYNTEFTAPEAGNYTLVIYAIHPETANSGVIKQPISVK